MRHVTSVTSFAALIIAFMQSALAADMPAKAAPVAPAPVVYNWTGFYIGGNFGGGGNSRSVDFVGADPAAQAIITAGGGSVPSGSFNTFGALGGVQLGYNWQFNRNWLLGMEADFDWSGLRGSGVAIGSGILAPTVSFEEEIKWFGTVRARLGVLPVDNFLAYITGGFAYGKVEHSAVFRSGGAVGVSVISGAVGVACGLTSPTCFTGSSSNTATGWTVGAGFEYALWRNWTVKAEYLFVSLESETVAAAAVTIPLGATSPAILNANFDRTDFHVGRIGANYRF